MSVSEISPGLAVDQFWSVNARLLQQQVAGFVLGTQQFITFSCGDEEIKGMYITFEITESYLDTDRIYQFAQYQFVDGDK